MFRWGQRRGSLNRWLSQDPGTGTAGIPPAEGHELVGHEHLAEALHEMHTLLFSVRGFTRLLLGEKGLDNRRRREFLTIVDRDIDRLNHLVDSALRATGPESAATERAPVSMKRVIAAVVASLSGWARERNIDIQAILPPTLPNVVGDEQRLGQVVANLLANAIKSSPRDSRVTVKAEVAYGGLLVSVADKGCGIPKNELASVFDRFYHRGNGNTDGVGLGLYIAKRIVQAHAGQIWVESDEGRGSVFRFMLPLAQPPSGRDREEERR